MTLVTCSTLKFVDDPTGPDSPSESAVPLSAEVEIRDSDISLDVKGAGETLATVVVSYAFGKVCVHAFDEQDTILEDDPSVSYTLIRNPQAAVAFATARRGAEKIAVAKAVREMAGE